MRWRLAVAGISGLLLLEVAALWDHHVNVGQALARLDHLQNRSEAFSGACGLTGLGGELRSVGSSPLLASWQDVAGCGASSATGGGAGIKWIGRSVTGGLFGVQCQATYSPLLADPAKSEHHFVVNTLISRELGDRWSFGVNVPYVYKYLRDPYQLDIDLSNGGLGDTSLQVTREMGPIAASALTATVGLPTGKSDTRFRNTLLRQHQQLGFGRLTGSLALDHTLEKTWGLVALGGLAAYRGGENELGNYRTASGSSYAFAGVYLGPFVPSFGLATTFFGGYDRDRTEEENSALFVVAANASIEWSTDWIAVLVGASLPYQYDAVFKNSEGLPKSPWRWGQWVLGFGVTVAPF